MDAQTLMNEGRKLYLDGKYDEAEQVFDVLLSQNPRNFGVLATAGMIYLGNKKYGQAICAMEHALDHYKERPADVLANLGLAYKYSGQREKGLKILEEAAKKNPTAPILATLGGEFIQTGDATKAIHILEKAHKADPSFGLAKWNLSLAYLEDGQFGKGFDLYDGGFDANMRKKRVTSVPDWDGKSPGKVWVYGEQGLGDEIMFASMLKDVQKTNSVVFESHNRLQTLFQKSFDFPVYGTRGQETIDWLDREKPDYVISIGSLGRFYRRERADFDGHPYLNADPMPKGKKFRVGISWTGGMKTGRIITRTVPLSWWRSILNNDCEFVSLQYTNCEDEVDEVNKTGYDIKLMPEAKSDDYYATAMLVKSCDLVISVCTSVIHLAGAMGVPCWVMTPKTPAWRYQNKGGMPWYRSVRLYRQRESWIPVVDRIGLDLSDLLSK